MDTIEIARAIIDSDDNTEIVACLVDIANASQKMIMDLVSDDLSDDVSTAMEQVIHSLATMALLNWKNIPPRCFYCNKPLTSEYAKKNGNGFCDERCLHEYETELG